MTQLFLFIGLGAQEIILLALVVLLIFGGKKIPELMKGIGQGVKSFKSGIKEGTDDEKSLNKNGLSVGENDKAIE